MKIPSDSISLSTLLQQMFGKAVLAYSEPTNHLQRLPKVRSSSTKRKNDETKANNIPPSKDASEFHKLSDFPSSTRNSYINNRRTNCTRKLTKTLLITIIFILYSLIAFIPKGISADYIIFPESESNKVFLYNITSSFLIQNGTEISPTSLTNPLAMDIDALDRKIYTTNAQSGTIVRFNFDGSNFEIIRKLNPLNSLTSGVSIDAGSKLLYYGDPGTDTICVMRLDGMFHRELFSENTTKVKAIQVAPSLGLLFWTDWGHPPKIERSFMDGSNRAIIIDSKLVMPWSLAVDEKERKLYWGDAKLKKIEVSDLDGTNRAIVLETKVIYPFGLTLYDDHLVWSDWSQSKLLALKKTERDAHHVIDPVDRLFDKLGDVKIYRDTDATYYKTKGICAFNNGGCSQLCFPVPVDSTLSAGSSLVLQKKCGCQDGSSLLGDGATCEGYKPLDEFLIVSDAYQGKIMVMDLSLTDRHFYLPITDLKRPDSVDYDPVDKFVYWIDEATKVIRRIHIDPTGPVNGRAMRFLNDLVSNPTGMAIDSLSRLIYYNNAGLKLMAVMDLDGNNHKVLIKNLEDPRALAIDPEAGLIFWTEWGETPSIKSAWGDGSNMKVLATEGVSNPTGIAFDHKEKHLYWCDARLDKIERMNYDGTNRSIIFFGTSIHPYGIAVDDNFIYWSDWTRSNILRSPKYGQYNDKLSLGPKVFSRLGTLRVIRKNRTASANGCAYTNGGCSHLCFPLPPLDGNDRRVSCACPDGLVLQTDKQTCSSETEMFDRFLLFADGVLPDIFVMNYDEPTKYHSIPNLNHSRPAALDYDPQDKFIYWSDVRDRSIKRASLDGTKFSVIKQLLPNVSLPDGLTLDPVTRLIYYSDTGRNTISVLSFDGTKHKDIISENLDEPRAIQLDSDNGYMFWTDWGSHAKIERAYMDGSNRVTLIEDDIVWPNGLSIDRINKRLFWVDAKRDILSTCDFNGQNIHVIVSMVRKHPFALTLTPEYFFWTDWITSTVRRLPRVDLYANSSDIFPPAASQTTPKTLKRRQLTGTSPDYISPFTPKQVAISSLTSAVTLSSDTNYETTLSPLTQSAINTASKLGNRSNASSPSGSIAGSVLASSDATIDLTNPTFSRLLDIHAYTGDSIAKSRLTNPCASPQNGNCSDLCFPVPDSRKRVCACSDLRYPNSVSTKLSITSIVVSSLIAKINATTSSPLLPSGYKPKDENYLLSDGMTCKAAVVCNYDISMEGKEEATPGVELLENSCESIGKLGAICKFKCAEGFEINSGDTTRVCQANGFWSGKPLRCGGKQCGALPSPINAIIESCPGTYGTKCQFKCSPGTKYVSGDFERTCSSDGNWSGFPLVCQKTSCLYPYLDEENVVASDCPDVPKPGQVCHLKCKSGFIPKVGSETSICQEDGSWSQPLLSCHALSCNSKPNPPNSVEISCYDSKVGTQCVHKCSPGYDYISGTKSRECLENGEWSGFPLICSKCPALPKPELGILRCTTYQSGLYTNTRSDNRVPECRVICDSGSVMTVDMTTAEGGNLGLTENGLFTCESKSGIWSPERLMTPGCSELSLPAQMTVTGTLALKVNEESTYPDNRNCQDLPLKNALTNWLKNSPMLLSCYDSELCDIQNFNLVCTSAKSDKFFTYDFSFQALNSHRGRIYSANTIDGVHTRSNQDSEVPINMTLAVTSFFKSIQSETFTSVQLIRGLSSFRILPESSVLERSLVECPAGHMRWNDDCAACPPGTFLSKIPTGKPGPQTYSTKCVPCPVGQYQGLSAQESCLKCPKGMSTSNRGSSKCSSSFGEINTTSALKGNSVTSGVTLAIFLVLFILIALIIGAFIVHQKRGIKLPTITKIPLPVTLTGRGKADQQEMSNVPYENF